MSFETNSRTPLHEEAMCEMATVNRKDHFKDFNCDEFKVVIKGPPREHLYKNKAHVHIFHKQDGWEIRMSMEGEYLGYVTLGNRDRTDTFSDIEKVFRKWLLRNCVTYPGVTNYIHIQNMWNSINEDLEIDVKPVLEALKPRKILNHRKTESPYNSCMEHYLAERAKNESAVYEMACLRKKRTGLPVNIYVDDSGVWKQSGHANKIKIQNNKGESPITTGMIPMSIGDDPDILIKNLKMELSQSDINAVKKFVIANKDLLNRLGDDIDIDDFIKAMVV